MPSVHSVYLSLLVIICKCVCFALGKGLIFKVVKVFKEMHMYIMYDMPDQLPSV